MHYFYIVRCADNSLYCGITNCLSRRIQEHNTDSIKGAKYTWSRRPVILVYSEEYGDLKTAMRRELQIKKWKRLKKEALVKGDSKLLKML